jgi:hypothetical protein
MTPRIVYTRPDGGVAICAPSTDLIAWMGCGGLFGRVPPGFAETETERQIAEGRRPDAVRRFVRAVLYGGCSTVEALAIIRDRDCSHLGTGHELWSARDIPTDRWFRDAWVRSHNGGPIDVSLTKARGIQFRRIKCAVDVENKRRLDDIDHFDCQIAPDWSAIQGAIRRAENEAELRRVRPLPRA